MTIVWKEDLLREAAGQMAVQTARLLPREEAPLSPPFQEKMGALLWRTKRQQKRRVMWQRAMAALLALVVAMGAVLAVSPQAQAAAKRWLMKITDVVTTYQFYPTAEETIPWDGLPQWTGEGYELTYDLQGDNGVRTLRYTSSQGDILLQRVTLRGTENTVEIRSRETDGLRDLQGQRPQGEEGTPKEYTMVETRVGPYEGQRYEFHTGTGYGDSGGDFGIRFYRDGEWFHHVAVLQGATALIWTDEEAQELFLLIGTDADALQRMAESIY